MIVGVCAFLQSLGGPYETISGATCENIAYSLASGQYVWKKNLYFAAYWRVKESDIPALRECRRPENITDGPLVYIVEAGSVGGVAEMVRKLHKQNPDAVAAMFHRGSTLKRFGLQRGETT